MEIGGNEEQLCSDYMRVELLDWFEILCLRAVMQELGDCFQIQGAVNVDSGEHMFDFEEVYDYLLCF